MSKWVAMDIGCIECGEPSQLIGVFDSENAAAKAAKAYAAEVNGDWDDEDKSGGYFSGGQHGISLFRHEPAAGAQR
jgi:hypothetical protein